MRIITFVYLGVTSDTLFHFHTQGHVHWWKREVGKVGGGWELSVWTEHQGLPYFHIPKVRGYMLAAQ